MMGSEEQGVSICFTTLPALARRFWTLNEIAKPIVPTGTIRMIAFGAIITLCLPLFSGFAHAATAGAGSLP